MTIRPLPRSRIPSSTARVHRNAPVALTACWRSHSASDVRFSGADEDTPALLTSTSTAPISPNTRATAASSVTSRSALESAITRSSENAAADRRADPALAAR